MHGAGSDVILLGNHTRSSGFSTGIDQPDQLALVPENFDGYVWTNRVEGIGPLIIGNR